MKKILITVRNSLENFFLLARMHEQLMGKHIEHYLPAEGNRFLKKM